MLANIGFKVVLGLVLLSPATSAAEPKREDVARVRYDDRKPAARAGARVPGDWIELSDATPARHGSEHIAVDPKVGPLARLRIEATGRVIVRRIKLYFDDGSQKVLYVDTTLAPGHAMTTLEIKRALPIDRIVVETEPQTRGSYTVQGSTTVASASMAKR